MFSKLLLLLMVGSVLEAVYHHNWNAALYWVGSVILTSSIVMRSV